MESDAEMLQAVAIHDPQDFDDVLKSWTEFFSQQSWPFDYTDKIARRCDQIWDLANHAGSRALIVCSLILLGNRHNRYFVWRVAASLVQRTHDSGDVRVLREYMFSMDESQLAPVCEYIDKGIIKQELRSILFRKAS